MYTFKFKLGKVVITKTVNETMKQNPKFNEEVYNSLVKYISCDWGDTCDNDSVLNDNAVKNKDDRIFAFYQTCEGRIYIITERDRSTTTIMFKDEY